MYRLFDEAFSDRCLEAALEAYDWAVSHLSVPYVQPSDCETGAYIDDEFSDEFFWASVELACATGFPETYDDYITGNLPSGRVPNRRSVGTLGLCTLLTFMHLFDNELVEEASDLLITTANSLVTRQRTGYGISMNEYDCYWGSNDVAASQGNLLLHAYHCTDSVCYRDAAEQQINYLTGRNQFSTSFITGFGTRCPEHPHQRIFQADGIIDPPPGFLVGGPHAGGEDTANCVNYVDKPANSWSDTCCSFAVNEVAINWNTYVSDTSAGES